MRNFFRLFWRILKGLGKTLSLISSFFFNLAFYGLFIVLLVILFRSKEPSIPETAILKLTISGDIVEQKREPEPFDNYISNLLGMSSREGETLLQDVLDVIDGARNDARIKALLLDLKSMDYAGLNQMESIGEALDEFRKSGKPVIAAEDYYNQTQYFLASHADSLFLNPMGAINMTGFGLYRLYFKDALEKLKINFHVFKVGSYKSAVEPFTRNSMSSADRNQSRTWLSVLWNNYVAAVSQQRSIDPDSVVSFINDIPGNLERVGGDLARLALSYGLVDDLKQRHELKAYLAGLVSSSADEEIPFVSFRTYLQSTQRSFQNSTTEKDRIALIFAQGSIIPGESGPEAIGAETLSKLLREAAKSKQVKAVVLRVNSGGGSAFASEIIRQEILELQKTGKPVVISMGTYAASGAYWLSANADEIWASPNTLTGSIGIFMAIPTFENLLDSAGIHRDGIGTTNLAPGIDLTSPLAPEVQGAIQLTIENGYRRFIDIVAQGRGMPVDEVRRIAQGRVFAGSDALNIGLVDRLGSLDQAIKSAADLAGISNYSVIKLEPSFSVRDIFFNRIGTQFKNFFGSASPMIPLLENEFNLQPEFRNMLLFRDPNGMYAHCMINEY